MNKGYFINKEVAGLDINKGVDRFGGQDEVYLMILRSFTGSVRLMSKQIENADDVELDFYKIKVHGIKGACYDIFAEEMAARAKKLEEAADGGDIEYIRVNNPLFITELNEFLNNVLDVIKQINEENPRPAKDKPDESLLAELLEACEMYDLNKADNVMDEIERFRYEDDGGLADWLREQFDMMNFDAITERLSG